MQRYREIVFEGAPKVVRAFLAGLAVGKGWAEMPVLCEDAGIRSEPLGHKILERLHLEKTAVHVVAPERQASSIVSAARQVGKKVGLSLKVGRPIADAYFEYRFRVFSRRLKGRIKRVLSALPPGVRLEDATEREIVEPEARGAELYTPEHEYVFEGSGTLRGAVPGLVELRFKMSRIEWFEVEEIRLVAGKPK